MVWRRLIAPLAGAGRRLRERMVEGRREGRGTHGVAHRLPFGLDSTAAESAAARSGWWFVPGLFRHPSAPAYEAPTEPDAEAAPRRTPPVIHTVTGAHLTPAERGNLRIFRQVAVEVRHALTMERGALDDFRIVKGYIESDAARRRVRALCVPVRRTYLRSDPVNFERILTIVGRSSRPQVQELASGVRAGYEPIKQDLKSASILNDRRITHAEMFEAWVDAMVFYEAPDKVRRYQTMAHELGKVVEGIGLHLAERLAEQVLALDDVVADFLEEPRAGSEPT